MNPEFWVHCVKTADGWWAIEVPDASVHTQSRTLAEVEPMARDAAALMLDVDRDSFTMEVVVDVPLHSLAGLDELLLLSQDKSWGALTSRLCARLERVEQRARNLRHHAKEPNPFRGSWRRPLWWFDAFCHSLGVHVRPLCDYLDRCLYR